MSDRKINNRVLALDHAVKQIRAEVASLKEMIGALRKDHVASVVEQHDTNQHEKSAAALLPADADPRNAEKNQKDSNQFIPRRRGIWRIISPVVKWPHWWRVAESIGIGAAVFYAGVSYKQWQDLRHNFQTDERSWIKIEYAWPNDSQMTTYHADWTVSAKVGMWNVGKSAITLLKGEGVFEILDAKKSPSFSLGNYHSTYIASGIFPSQETDFPIELFNQTTQSPRAFTQEEYDGLRSGTKYVAVFGYITYKDQFGVHWYRFCSWRSYTTTRVQVDSGECVPFNKIGDGTSNLPFGRKYDK